MRPVYSKLVILLFSLASVAWAAAPQFSGQKRVGLTSGDQWEPAVAADGSGRIYVLYPHYGRVSDCKGCKLPTMLLVASNDNGKTWQTPHVMLESGSGQFDAQIAVDPADRRTVYAAWLQNGKRAVMLAKSVDSEAVADALRKNPTYDHYKGKQWWRTCDNKSFQDLWIVKGREPGKVKGEWGLAEIVTKIPANEELDRTCKEKGQA